MAINKIAKLREVRLREGRYERACKDLRFLAIDILGYTWCAGEWHKEVFDFIDANQYHPRVAVFAPRFSYKSRIQCAEIVQEILKDPFTSIALIHHKLDLARELVVEIGELFQKNDALRELLPSAHRPGPKTPSFVRGSGQGGEFSLPGTGRAKATLKGFSADQDLTGAHPSGPIFLDDIISAKTVDYFGGIEGIRNWIRHTIIPLAGASGRLRVKGTMWSPEDFYSDIMSMKSWNWMCRAILEDDNGKPDEVDGKPISIFVGDSQAEGGKRPLNMTDVQRYKEEMKAHFQGQMMNNAKPRDSHPWNQDTCEHYVQLSQVRQYIKKVVVLTDPAPLGMSADGKLIKPDGTKDYWATAVIGYMKSKNKTVRVLLDGSMSQQWSLDQGLKDMKRQMKKWNAKIAGIEEPLGHGGVGFYGRALKDKFGKGEQMMGFKCKPIKFKSTQRGKPPRIMDLCAMAGMTDEDGDLDPLFVICKDTCDEEFLEMFLTQARDWSGSKSIKHDDCLDCVAYLDDPALMEFVKFGGTTIDNRWDKLTAPRQPMKRKTRYCNY